MSNRYRNRRVAKNSTDEYQDSEIFKNRGVKKIIQYASPKFKSFTKEQYDSVPYVKHYWRSGDRFWKLANKYYRDASKWWIIARWNFKPTESHLNEGDEIRIPKDPRKVLELIK